MTPAIDALADLDESDLQSDNLPPPPDPKEHPGGRVGGLLDRVMHEEAVDDRSKSEKSELRLRLDGMVRRIISAL